MNRISVPILFLIASLLCCQHNTESPNYDVVVYGGTPSGIIAAVSASRNGAQVLLIEQTKHVGGLSTSGLNTAETEHMINNAITGYAREFYIRMGRVLPKGYYDRPGRVSNFKAGDPAF